MTLEQLRQLVNDPQAPQFEWSEDLKAQIWQRQDNACWICAQRIVAICHLIHRGMGGNRRRNNPRNLIGLCQLCHDRLDGRAQPRLRIRYYDPEDREHGLIVEEKTDDGWRTLERAELAFYFNQE